MKTMKIRKMENKELKKVVGQCCCKIVGKPSVYETDSCCLADKKVAMKKLGMKYPTEKQVVYYTVENSNFMDQYEDIPSK